MKIRGVVGFTGTRRGMTYAQRVALVKALKIISPRVVHHGDCIGADEAFHGIVRHVLPDTRIIVHPPRSMGYRAFCQGDEALKELPYLVRNCAIVDACKTLLVAPKQYHEIQRSGTWQTYRYGKQQRRTVITLWPDGCSREEEFG